MHITHRLITAEEQMKVIAWHEDTAKKDNYVLTVLTELGRTITGVERNNLSAEQIKELKRTVPKDSTGL